MKKSLISILQNTIDKNDTENHLDHFIIGVDMDINDNPNSSMIISHGKPFATLGMIDILIKNLQDVKKDILLNLSTKNHKYENKIDSLINALPADIKQKISSIKQKIDTAIKNNDIEALEKAKEELYNIKDFNQKKDDDEDNFNITDFKGGMA